MSKSTSSQAKGPVRAAIFAVVASTTGLISLFILSNIIDRYQVEIADARQPEDTVMAMVASRDLYQGITITDDDLYAVEIAPRYLPENVFLSPEHVVGRIPRERILANEFVRSGRLADPESGLGLHAVIPRGMRAISVDIADGQALSGFLNPTNFVDVLVTLPPLGDQDDSTTQTLLQAVFVLGVNTRSGSESSKADAKRGKQPSTVTLLVSADQAEQVALADASGALRLSLRGGNDAEFAESHGISGLDALRNKMKTVPEVVHVPKPEPVAEGHTVIVIRGDDVEEVRFDAEDRETD